MVLTCVARIKAKTEWQTRREKKQQTFKTETKMNSETHLLLVTLYIKRAKNLISVECDVIAGSIHIFNLQRLQRIDCVPYGTL